MLGCTDTHVPQCLCEFACICALSTCLYARCMCRDASTVTYEHSVYLDNVHVYMCVPTLVYTGIYVYSREDIHACVYPYLCVPVCVTAQCYIWVHQCEKITVTNSSLKSRDRERK